MRRYSEARRQPGGAGVSFDTAACPLVGRGRPCLWSLRRRAFTDEWTVLNWNTPAQDFYRSLGAVPMDEWTVWRLTGDALTGAARDA